MEKIIAGKFTIGQKIGAGAFGEVFEGKNRENGQLVAIKLEKANTKVPQLLYEAKILKLVQGRGIPCVYWSGLSGPYNVMVMELLGSNLETLLTQCKHKFSVFTTVNIASQMIDRIENVHNNSFIHRDIKPENFVIGRSDSQLIYIVDFGLAKRYRDPRRHFHIPYKDGKNLTGTARYSSVNTHIGIEQSRRDDIEALAYVFLYFLRGNLPWMGLRAYSRKEKYTQIMEIKMSTPGEILCKSFPNEFASILYYARSLQFEEAPNYKHIRRQLFEVLKKVKPQPFFDWLLEPEAEKSEDRSIEGVNSPQKSPKKPDEEDIEEIPGERIKQGVVEIVPRMELGNNERHFLKYKKRKCIGPKSGKSVSSTSTDRQMPSLTQPQEFRRRSQATKRQISGLFDVLDSLSLL